jgi:4-hydroxy-tetrahydrodipicolinate synthase
MMSIGAEGVVSVAGNIVPHDVISMVEAAAQGDYAMARQWHHKLFALCRDMLGLSTNPIPVKTAMKLLGRDAGELRLPLTPLTETEVKKLHRTLTDYGLTVS